MILFSMHFVFSFFLLARKGRGIVRAGNVIVRA